MTDLARFFLPAGLTCMGCDAVTWGEDICPACAAQLAGDLRMPLDGCPDCGGIMDENGTCPRCQSFGTLQARSVWKHALVARTLVHRLKFNGTKEAAAPMIAAMAEMIQTMQLPEDTWITCVTMPQKRLRERGIDHARVLAEGVAQELHMPFRSVLHRVHDRKLHTQQGLDGTTRAENVKNTFACTESIHGTVLLIDDVLTTGATALECVRALTDAGADRVITITATRGGQKD